MKRFTTPAFHNTSCLGSLTTSLATALQAHTEDASYLICRHYHISLVQAQRTGTHVAAVIPTSSLVPVSEP